MTMMPGMNPNEVPPFFTLGETAFQEMCRDLFEREVGIRTCEIYGVRGEQQLGIDLIAQSLDYSSSEVGQCKCYLKFPPAQIRRTSDEFLKHFEYWREKNVKRFILLVASPLEKKNQQDEINNQIKRFADYGIVYEAWSSRTLRTKLRLHPDLVRRYIGSDEWVKNICGGRVTEESGSDHDGLAGRDHSGGDKRAVENEIEELTLFKKLFGFEAKRPMRKAVVTFYNASRNIGRRSIRHASNYLTEEGEMLKVVISMVSHIWNIGLGTVCALFFLAAVALSPVWRDMPNSRLSFLMYVCSTISLGMAILTFWIFNNYLQALRIKSEIARLNSVP